MEPTLKDYLKELISWYSLEQVHTSLDLICKEEFAFLKKLYAPTTTSVPKRVSDASGSPVTSRVSDASGSPVTSRVSDASGVPVPLEQQEEPKLRPDAKVRVVKKPTEDSPFVVTPVTAPTPVPVTVPVPVPVTVPTQHESGMTDPKDLKRWQKEQEEKKKRELDAQGINPASLLTKENLQRWIVEEKKTYAAVAREYVGLPDSMVASAAKSFGIQSDTTKKRTMIAATKGKK
jgi:hypothetical protein